MGHSRCVPTVPLHYKHLKNVFMYLKNLLHQTFATFPSVSFPSLNYMTDFPLKNSFDGEFYRLHQLFSVLLYCMLHNLHHKTI